MPLALRGVSVNYSTTNAAYDLRVPVEAVAGDILLCGVSIRGQSMPVLDPFWKPILSSQTGNGATGATDSLPGYAHFWAIHNGAAPPTDVTRSGTYNSTTDVHTINVIALSGGSAPEPVAGFTQKHRTIAEAVSLFTTIPGQETDTPDEMIVLWGHGARNGTYRVPVLDIVDPPPGDFSQVVHASSSTGSDTLLAAWIANKAAPGATGDARIEHSVSSRHSGVMLRVRSQAPAPPAPLIGRRQRMVLVS